MLVHNTLEKSAERYPTKTALVCGDEGMTYVQLESAANAFAMRLVDAGITRGDRVAICLPNSVEMAVAIYGVLKAGAVFVPVNHAVKAHKLAYVLNDCAASGFVGDARAFATLGATDTPVPSLSMTVATAGEGLPGRYGARLTYAHILETRDPSPPRVTTIDQDLACLIYTSGSTGEPKGVVCGHNNVVFASGSIIEYLGNIPDDVVIALVPFSFDYGLYQLLMTVRFGGTLVIENSFAYPAAVMRTVARMRVTGLPLVPTLAAMLLQLDTSAMDLSSLRYITNTAAALPESHIRALQERFPSARIYSMYGMTECKRTLYLPPERLREKPASVGMAIPGTEVWLQAEDGRRCEPGETGELVVRGAHVMRGYWNDQALTERYYRPGPTAGERVLYTNDLFRADEEGLLYFVARRDDIIKSRGEKVAPREVEGALCEHAGIVEAAVVGVPDPRLGQAVVAFIVRSQLDLDEREVRRHCAARLEPFMVPQRIEFVDSLPRTANGKVDKKVLTMGERV